MRKYFFAGLITLLPVAVTLVLVAFVIDFLTQPFVGLFEHFLLQQDWYFRYRGFIHILLQVVLIFVLFFLTVLLGFLARIVFFKSLLALHDYIMQRIPIVKTIYKATQQLIKTIFGDASRSFKQVVMAPFPSPGVYCIGLISSGAPAICSKTVDKPLITVFIPTTPNPTSGFLMLYKEEDLIYIDMRVEEALKFIISCGVITNTSP